MTKTKVVRQTAKGVVRRLRVNMVNSSYIVVNCTVQLPYSHFQIQVKHDYYMVKTTLRKSDCFLDHILTR